MQTRTEVNPSSFTLLKRDNHRENPGSPRPAVPVNWGEVVEIEAGTSSSEGAPGGGGPAPGGLLPTEVRDWGGKETWQLHFLLARQRKPD